MVEGNIPVSRGIPLRRGPPTSALWVGRMPRVALGVRGRSCVGREPVHGCRCRYRESLDYLVQCRTCFDFLPRFHLLHCILADLAPVRAVIGFPWLGDGIVLSL